MISTHSRERDTVSSSINRLQHSITDSESIVDQNKFLQSDFKFNSDDLAERRTRLEKMVKDFADAKFDQRMAGKAKEIANAQTERDILMTEHSKSSMQASERATLDLKRGDLKKKQAFVERLYVSFVTLVLRPRADHLPCRLETHSAKFRMYLDVDAQPETMESDVDQLLA